MKTESRDDVPNQVVSNFLWQMSVLVSSAAWAVNRLWPVRQSAKVDYNLTVIKSLLYKSRVTFWILVWIYKYILHKNKLKSAIIRIWINWCVVGAHRSFVLCFTLLIFLKVVQLCIINYIHKGHLNDFSTILNKYVLFLKYFKAFSLHGILYLFINLCICCLNIYWYASRSI